MQTLLAAALVAVLLCIPAMAKDYTPKECPVVGNTNSMIYHVSGGHFYARMLRENPKGDNRQCFNSTKAAQAAGYRASGR
jgi:hypothetical protein